MAGGVNAIADEIDAVFDDLPLQAASVGRGVCIERATLIPQRFQAVEGLALGL